MTQANPPADSVSMCVVYTKHVTSQAIDLKCKPCVCTGLSSCRVPIQVTGIPRSHALSVTDSQVQESCLHLISVAVTCAILSGQSCVCMSITMNYLSIGVVITPGLVLPNSKPFT